MYYIASPPMTDWRDQICDLYGLRGIQYLSKKLNATDLRYLNVTDLLSRYMYMYFILNEISHNYLEKFIKAGHETRFNYI